MPLEEKGFPFNIDGLDLTASGILDGLGDEDTGVGRPCVIAVDFGVDVPDENENFSLRMSTVESKGAEPLRFNASRSCRE